MNLIFFILLTAELRRGGKQLFHNSLANSAEPLDYERRIFDADLPSSYRGENLFGYFWEDCYKLKK